MRVIDSRIKLAEDFVDSHYSLWDFLMENDMGQLSGNRIACPFHEDESPSLFINLNENKWHCHSCKRGGRYVAMQMHYFNLIDGKKWDYHRTLDYLLKEHSKAHNTLGFDSIYQTDKQRLKQPLSLSTQVRKKHRPAYRKNLTNNLLMRQLKSTNPDTVVMALAQLQQGHSLTPKEFAEIENPITMEDILGGDIDDI